MGSKGAFLKKMDEKEVLILKGDSTTLLTGRKRWLREKPGKLFKWWYIYIYIYIYIMMAHNIKIFFYMKYLMIKYWWVTSYEFVVRIIYLKGLFPHNSTYWVISPLFISPYRYIRGIIGVEILGRQQLWIIL